ncbi:MAG: OmpA family protein [Candidatus Pseudobacter hemicellulosilyticus]|uniref:OmpA family protein n=1 Tax=Candidatus Pseudobacter hemicellulosilyticus TaxID=3121375 RepID=A0AAJ5WXA3_9BACT|nr:MAG: OmpA family protein [Pseudobacter sp.]
MKKIAILLICVTPIAVQAQLGGLMNKAKNKVINRANNKVDQAMEKGLDKAEEAAKKDKNKKAGVAEETAATAAPASEARVAPSGIVSYSKYDFVPGEKILLSEDFASDNIGETPLSWNTRGKGELVTLDKFPGKWLRMFPGTIYLTGNDQPFGENYTIEFDMVMQGTAPSGTRFLPPFHFGLFGSDEQKVLDNGVFAQAGRNAKNYAQVTLEASIDKGTRLNLMSDGRNNTYFRSEPQALPDFNTQLSEVVHVAIQVQKTRFRCWINQHKVFDAPRAVQLNVPLNNLFFEVDGYSSYNETNYGMYVNNLKVATGLPDSRHKLIEEGKFSTTGILFDNNSAVVRPESVAVLKEIADVLKEYKDIKVQIVGHTSSDGDDAANLELSQKRAAAVAEKLSAEFGIDATRMETAGKGESQPVGDNKTKEGKAQNRRVEFIKL